MFALQPRKTCDVCGRAIEMPTVLSDRTGLGAIERAVLEALDDLEARPDRPHRKSANMMGRVYDASGIGPRFAYETACVLAAPWLVHLRLIDFHGNLGGPDEVDESAGPRYTEIRLSRAGAFALAAERGELPRLPIGLINGDLNAGGTSPPFEPTAIARAVERAGADTGAGDAELIELVGPPSFPTACSVKGDITALAAGEPADLRLSARVSIEADRKPVQIVISHLPYRIGLEAVASSIQNRAMDREPFAHRNPALNDRLGIPLTDMTDESTAAEVRLVCSVKNGADAKLCRDRILETWPVTIKVAAQLARPLPALVRALVDDPTTQSRAIAALLAER
jgi:DNA gyrase/topoisomerase IV subunit A